MADLRKYANNFTTTLNGAITDSATSITLTSASGLPSIGANENFNLTIFESGVGTEIVTVTDDASSPTFTVTRGVDGTSGLAFSDGALVELRLDSLSFEDVLSADESPQLRGDLDLQTHKVTTSTSNGDIELDSDGTGNIIFSNDASELGRITDDGKLLLGTTTEPTVGSSKIVDASPQLVISNTDNDTTNKTSSIGGMHYTSAEEPVTIVSCLTSNSNNTLSFGGNVATQNAATLIRFMAAANTTTLTGTEIIRVATDGLSFDSGSNFLNDYEEGTHTATVTCSTSGSYTLSQDDLAYTRIGNKVHLQGELVISGESSPSGDLQISLPFTSASLAGLAGRAHGTAVVYNHGGTIADQQLAFIGEGVTVMTIKKVSSAGAVSVIDDADVDSAFGIFIGITYEV